ncbi:nascent polypeptide-associated complex subunit alpha, muscle-specific form-like [Sturnira hondurensis]|uniref:nascent polypeptide-associated complex subunit alpha, muscle-specific form-like n=1 Tax=Sturnira hondurensis TaxID=192404 RepID=UPI001879EA0A|nr:nascent polypeptide-associated complex subunit alpha, muscle-specific form-like [Sturnira hondurensis]
MGVVSEISKQPHESWSGSRFRARSAGPPNRWRAELLAPHPSRAGPQLHRLQCWASAFSQRRRAALGLGREIGSASGGAAAREVLGRGSGRHRPAGKALQLRRSPRCGTQDREGGSALAVPGPAQCRPGGVAAGRLRPRRASRRGPQTSRPPPRGALRLPRFTCAGRLAPRCGGVCVARASPPAASGAGAGLPSTSPVRLPPSVSPVRPPRSAAGRELPGDRGSGCCLPVRPLACSPPLLPLLLGPWPAVYMPVKPLATPSPSELQLPEGETSRPRELDWSFRPGPSGLRSPPALPPPPPSGRDRALVY